MALSDTAIRHAKPTDKPFKLTDGDGMYLLVNMAGRYFRLNYRFPHAAGTMDAPARGEICCPWLIGGFTN